MSLTNTAQWLVPTVFDTSGELRLYNLKGCLGLVGIAAVLWTALIHYSDVPLRISLLAVPRLVRDPVWQEYKATVARLYNSQRYQPGRTPQQLVTDHEFCRQVRNRAAGMLNALVSVAMAVYCSTADKRLTGDKLCGTSWSWVITGASISGYFIWDIGIILFSSDSVAAFESFQWMVHALICLVALISPFFAKVAPMSYYAALLVLFEASTPFMGLRWFCLQAHGIVRRRLDSRATQGSNIVNPPKDGRSVSAVGRNTLNTENLLREDRILESHINRFSLLFALAFFVVRIIVAPTFLLFPLMKILLTHPLMGKLHFLRWTLYVTSIPMFFLLNCFWMCMIIAIAVGGKRSRRGKQSRRFDSSCDDNLNSNHLVDSSAKFTSICQEKKSVKLLLQHTVL